LKRYLVFLVSYQSCGQNGETRHNLEVGGGGVFPIGGWLASNYSTGPPYMRATNSVS